MRTRRKAANFPTGKTFSSWRPEQSSIPEPTQQSLMTLELVGRHENVALAGPSGTGKSHFVEAPASTSVLTRLRLTLQVRRGQRRCSNGALLQSPVGRTRQLGGEWRVGVRGRWLPRSRVRRRRQGSGGVA
nr:ATP-binding protein [Kibdelosporangium phytohabitans]